MQLCATCGFVLWLNSIGLTVSADEDRKSAMVSLSFRNPSHTRLPGLNGQFSQGIPWTQPFLTVEEAWFWTIATLNARREGSRGTRVGGVPRPCEPDDVLKCLDRLYRRRRVDLAHARVLRVWGEHQVAPNPAYPPEKADAQLWREAINALEWPLRSKGIVI